MIDKMALLSSFDKSEIVDMAIQLFFVTVSKESDCRDYSTHIREIMCEIYTNGDDN